ncbi:hypothetical protein KSF_038680 [Reticulibacter mediterranei]|uniref:TIR domain-containing protein n=1 Tax=Reticulibacter mediterranei TaxID=2778369 RepID=A0A8J3N341_9CHLR|nr:toll/interleukin-1 receptor domain-containing protein [Reticulibacter mediterranei]GHO93820.1 hypothetical protein KSF_038680 [Reticulibacter mediterranei]
MNHQQHTDLIQLLLRIPDMQSYTTRTTLLAGVPNSSSLLRNEGNPYTDISLLISQLTDLYLSSGEWALLIFLNNARSRIIGISLANELETLRHQLVAQAQRTGKTTGSSGSANQPQSSQTIPPAQTDDEPIAIFYCYAPEDERYCRELEKQLAVMRRNKLITSWHSLDIQAGAVAQDETDRALQAADIVLLLVSPDFMASDRLYEEQVKAALLRRETGIARVIPIIVRDTAEWENSEFGMLTALPPGKKSVKAWGNSDAAFASIAVGIRRVVEELRSKRRSNGQ